MILRLLRLFSVAVLIFGLISLVACGGTSVGAPGSGGGPSLSLSPATLAFGNQTVNTAVTATATVTNTGNSTLVISSAALSGAQAADFSFSPSTFPISISAGSSAIVSVTFKPAAEGGRSATLSISDNATGSPHSLLLSGTGTVPKISSSSQSVSFPQTLPNTTSAPLEVTISNQGSGNLVISSLQIAGTNASEFAVQGGTLPMTVAGGSSTTLQLTFTPTGAGTRTAALAIASNADGSPLSIALSGTSPDLEQDPSASVALSPNSGATGGTSTVIITGTQTNFVQGATMANFGPGTATGSGAQGAFGTVTVTGPTSATASVAVSSLAATGPRIVLVKTGTHISAATFTVTSSQAGQVANAGPPQSVKVGGTVHLDGSGSTGSPLQFQWSLLSQPQGSAATLSSDTAVNPSFVADQQGNYLVQLEVDGVSAGWTVISTENAIPVANAGPDQFIAPGTTVHLDGSKSTSPDGDSLTYQWTVISKPAGSTASLSNGSAVAPTFVADQAGTYVLELTVNDGRGNNSSDQVSISTASTTPIANAGPKQTVPTGVSAHLDGSASKDPDGDPLTYEWKFTYLPDGSAATLANSHAVNPTFTPDVAGTYALELKVSDSDGNSSYSSVVIDTVNSAPTADAGPRQNVSSGITVHLDGSASSDPDNDPLLYVWSLIHRPDGSSATLTGGDTASPTFDADQPGEYVAQLIVSDGTFTSVPKTVLIEAAAPGLLAQPSIVSFGNQLVNTTSNSQTIMIRNTGNSALTISSFGLTGSSASEFAFTSAALPIPLAAGASTSVNVTFTPSSTGTRAATLLITSNAPGSPQMVEVQGMGTAPGFAATPSPLDFGNKVVGAPASLTLLVSNTGTGPLTVSNIAKSGTNASEFSFSSASLPFVVPAGANAAVVITFTPATTGQRSAVLTITHSAQGSPSSVTLTGKGALPGYSVNSNSLDFGGQLVNTTSSPKTVTITNTGDADLVINNLNLAGTNAAEFAFSSSALPITIAPAASANVTLTFKPTATGTRTASLVVIDNAAGSPHTVALTGKGTAPVFGTSPASINFASQEIGTTSSQLALTINNTGGGELTITNLAISGTNASEFAFIPTGLPISVAPGGNTLIHLTFSPAAAGTRSASLTITDSASGSPHAIALSGTGIVIPRLTVNPASLTFTSQLVGTSSQLPLTLSNTGTGDLVISSLAVSGANGADFVLTAPATPITISAGNSQQVTVKFTPLGVGARSGSLTVTSNATGGPQSVALTGTGIAPVFGASPASVTFPDQQVSTTSAPVNLTISNTGTGDLVISNLAMAGSNTSDFTYTAGSLPITVHAGQNTIIGLRFSPTATGARAASLTITDSATGSPHNVSLSGTGTAPAFGIAPVSVTFNDQLVGVQSAATTITITNTGTADLVISSLSLAGSNPGDFGFTPASGLPITVTKGNTTTVAVTFTPSVVGNRSASLSIGDNAGGPHSVALSGKGVTPGRLVNPNPVAFGNQEINTSSAATTVTITNSGTANLTISNIALSGANATEFTLSGVGTLPITVAPGNNTTVSLQFKPTAVGVRSASLVITDNANGSPYSLALSGSGTAPIFGANPASLDFGNQNAGTTSVSKTLVISNTGTANLVITNISKAGAQASEFAFTSGTLPITVAPNSSVNVGVTFSPAAGGARSASLTFASNAPGSPNSVALTGMGTAPGFSPSPVSLDFGKQNQGTPSSAKTITITNTGNGDLTISSVSKTGANTTDFSVTTATLPVTVTPGNTTTLTVTFTPGSTGARSAALSVSSNDSGSPHSIALSGTGTAPGFGANPTTINFGNQNVNSTSTPVTVTISNPGTGDLTISNITPAGTNAGDFSFSSASLPITVPSNGSTALQVAFKPTATGTRSGNLSITTNATGSPQSISLSGTGTAPTAIITPSSVTYSSQEVNTVSAAQTVNVSNTGNGDLIISALAFSGGNPGDFQFTSNPLPITVPPNGNAEISVKFAPTAAGARTTTLFITHNAGALPGQVSLTGTGIAPVIVLSPSSIDYGSLQVNTTASSNLTIKNTGTASLVISNLSLSGTNASEFSYSAALPITIAPNTQNVVSVTFAPQGTGSRTATLNLTSNAAGSPHSVALSGTATSLGTFSMPSVSVGKDLEALATASVSSPAPAGGINVTVSSSDPTKLLLASDATVLGQGSINVTIPQGFTTIPLGFYVQGVASSGTVQIRVSATGYVAATATATLTPSGFVLGNPSNNFSTSTLSPDTTVSVLPAQLDLGLNVIAGATGRLRGGITVNVPVSSSNTNVADILNGPSAFTGGNTAGTDVAFHPKTAGTAQITVGVPAGFSMPTTKTSVTATVTQPNITLSPLVVGMNMQMTGSGFLQAAAPTGGLTVTLTSPDPSMVKLSTDPTALGTASINVVVPQGAVLLPTYYVQGFASSGAVNLSVSAPGYAAATEQIALAPSGFVIAGPSGTPGENFSTTTISSASNVQLMLMQLTSGLQPQTTGALRGGLSVSVPVTNSNTSVGTITNGPAVFQAGAMSATLLFQPSTGGATTLGVGTPSIGGFSTPASETQLVATVTNPAITLNLAAPTVGANLEILASGALTAPAPADGVQITLTSNNPNVLLSSDTTGTTAGAQSISIFVPPTNGYQGKGFPAFYVQALAASGTAQITASATGWDPATVTVNLAPSGITLASANGIGQDLGVSLSSGNNATIIVNPWQLNATTLLPERSQAVRGGLTLTVPVSSGTPAVGTVTDSPATLAGGTTGVALTFHPTALGTTLLQATEPSGFNTPMGSGTPLNQLTAHVN